MCHTGDVKKVYHLVDPNGVEWFLHSRTLNRFVLGHPALFDSTQLVITSRRVTLAAINLNRLVCPSNGKWHRLYHCIGWSSYGAPSKQELQEKRVSAANRWRAAHPEQVRAQGSKNGKSLLGKACRSMKLKRGTGHFKAVTFRLRSPNGQTFGGKNICEFVRTQSGLFNPEDVLWTPRKPGSLSTNCRAVRGLSAVLIGTVGVWKGWTALSVVERKLGTDPLARNPA